MNVGDRVVYDPEPAIVPAQPARVAINGDITDVQTITMTTDDNQQVVVFLFPENPPRPQPTGAGMVVGSAGGSVLVDFDNGVQAWVLETLLTMEEPEPPEE
jgi:hypothetical protein